MRILGIDTSGKSGGICLAEGSAQTFRVMESCPIAGGTFSAQLVPTIAQLMAHNGRSIQELDGFAVASGPGSFTGLRVGLSAVKGLAEVLEKPIAAVSLLEAMAISSGRAGRVGAARDAGRSEVFWGVYQIKGDSAVRVPAVLIPAVLIKEELLSQTEFLNAVRDDSLAAAVLADKSLADLASSSAQGTRVEVVDRPGSEAVARIGLRKLLAGETVSNLDPHANYIRRSDAEIFSRERR